MADKFAIIAVIGLTAFAVCMGAASGLADLSLSGGKSRCALFTAASRALNWDGSDHVGLAALRIAR
jgi:hypothetical protein